jgi:hypothetical protein
MKNKTIRLTKSEIEHLLCLIHDNQREGNYWGNKIYYWKRSERIESKLKSITTKEGETK